MPASFAKHKIHFYQNPFLILLGAAIAGILLQQLLLTNLSPIVWWLFFGISFLLSIVSHLIKTTAKPISGIRICAILSCIISLAAISCFYHDIRNDKHWYGNHLPHITALQLKITDPPQAKEKTTLLSARVEKILMNDQWKDAKGKLNLYVYQSDSLPNYQLGDALIIPNELIAIKNSGNPFSFDYAAYASRNNLYHQAFLPQQKILFIPGNKHAKSFFNGLRSRLIKSIETNVKDSNTASLIEAVLLNERSTLSDDLWKAYSVTGIVHIIAISGGHIAIFCSIILGLLYFLKNKKWNIVKYVAAIVFVWFYIMITNYPPSAVRAAIMFTMIAFAQIVNRENRPFNTLAATGFFMLLLNPNWLYDVGVQLSFLAVLSMMIFYKPIYNVWIPKHTFTKHLWQLIALSIAVQVLVFPLVIYYFHQFPLWVLIANIPAALFSVLLMTGSLLLFIISLFGSCVWLGNILIGITNIFHAIILWMAKYTPTSFRELYIDKTEYWIMMAGIVLFSLYFFDKKKRYLLSALTMCCLLLISFTMQDIKSVQQKKLVLYNVSRQTLIDFFDGKNVKHYPDSVVDEKTNNYNLLPARLGFRAHKIINGTKNIWEVGGKKILLLDKNYIVGNAAAFPIDYLIVTDKTDFNPKMWQMVFQPKQIILDGSLPRWKAKKWNKELTEAGANVYWVQESGAWVFGK